MKKLIYMGLLSTAFAVHAANPEPVIYGTVTDESGKQVTGTIRWGDQEAFLSDIFNGEKIATIGIEHLSNDEKEALEDHQPGPQAKIGGVQITFISLFGSEIEMPYYSVPFGAIKQLTVDDANDLFVATLHDGTELKSTNNSNDLTDEIFVMTAEGNTIEYDLEDIKSVVFAAAPTTAKTYDDGIYGTVTSEFGTFQGRIMWDKDERMVSEKLDGSENNQEYEIKFADIKRIEKKDNASWVTLKNGQSHLLTGTNDVDNSNRGIWLDNPQFGRLEINWNQFKEAVFEDVDVKWMTFNDYQQNSRILSGTITLEDDSVVQADGIAYDLNHQSSAELLEVDVNKTNRLIPLGTIKSITKINELSATLAMRDGSQLVAYGNRVVNRDNNGILTQIGDEYRWIMWQDIKSIEFD